MILQMVILHADCPVRLAGGTDVPPKFAITDFSDDGLQQHLTCAACDQQLTLTIHPPDNPPQEFPHHADSGADGEHEPYDDHGARVRGPA